MAVFYSGVFYSGVYFTDSDAAVKTGTGGIDPEGKKRRPIVKPTGILHRPKKEGRKDVQDRVDESQQIQAEIAGRLAKEFSEESQQVEEPPALEVLGALAIEQMSQAQIDFEIGVRLRKKLKDEEDELITILTILAHVV